MNYSIINMKDIYDENQIEDFANDFSKKTDVKR